MKLEGTKIGFLGDSITEGCCVKDMSNRFDNVLASKYGVVGKNYGVGGTRISFQHMPSLENPRWDLNFAARADRMPNTFDVIIVYGGTNDFGHGDAPFGELSDQTPLTFCGAVRYLIKLLKRKFPDTRIIFMTPAKRFGCYEATSPKSPSKKMLVNYVDAMIEITKDEGVDLLDLYRVLPFDPNVPDDNAKYFADGLHLSDEGHRVLAETVKDFLEKL